MKKQHLFFTAVLAAFCFSSCQKEEKAITHFTAGMEQASCQQGTKTYLDGTLLKWIEGDQVKVFGTAGGGALFSAIPQEDDDTWAELEYVSGGMAFGPYKAIYPASIAVDAHTVTLPAVQYSTDGSLSEFPMYAESTTDVFQFKNLCGVLKIHLQQNDVSIKSITVNSNIQINGLYAIDVTGPTPSLHYVNGGSSSTTLTCSVEQDITNGKDFYIYIPAGSYNGLSLTFTASDNSTCTKNSTQTIQVIRSQYDCISVTEMEFEPGFPEGALVGTFTVNNSGHKVLFSRGNLQYTTTGSHVVATGETHGGTWRFAEHQYDCIGSPSRFPPEQGVLYFYYPGNVPGSDNAFISSNYEGYIDLFGWGTSGWNSGAVAYLPFSTSEDDSDYWPGNSSTNNLTGAYRYADWGIYNAISNGGNQPMLWRTLTSGDGGEWDYILNLRTTNTTNMAAGSRYAEIRVYNGTYICGLLLFPDTFSWPVAAGTPPSQVNNSSRSALAWGSAPVYDTIQFAELEASGCVFLPAAGSRQGVDGVNCGGYGDYWSSTACDASLAYYMSFGDWYTAQASYYRIRSAGSSVRLVQDIE